MITFNNIVERFEVFATNHFFIKSFSFGSPDDVDLSKFEEFPLMHLVYTGATYDAGTKTYNLEVYILDVPNDKKGKVIPQKEAISDAEQCAEDIIADIRSGGNIFRFAEDYEVVNATTTPLEEETKNVLSGILLDISVAIPYEWDACNAPLDGVTPGGGTEPGFARRGFLRMLTLDGSTDVLSVRTINVTNGTLTDDGDGVVTLDTGGVETLEELTDVNIIGEPDQGDVISYNTGTDQWMRNGGLQQLLARFKASGTGAQMYDTLNDTTKGYVDILADSATMKVNNSGMTITEASPGVLSLSVAAGTEGNEVEFEAFVITGSDTSTTASDIVFKYGSKTYWEIAGGKKIFLRALNVEEITVVLPSTAGQLALTTQIPDVPVDSVNGQTGVVVLDTGDIDEDGNLYYTEARVEANSAVVANTAKVGITPTQASEITANTAKTGITTQQAADITTNNAKTGITPTQAGEITANTAKVGLIAGGTTGQALVKTTGTDYDVEWSDIAIDTQYHDRFATDAETLRSGATATVELYYTAKADGDGLAESASSDTPTAGYVINRKIYYSEEGFADPDTATWVEFTPAPADDASFTTVKAALLEYLKARTGGTVPISLKQTWEETAEAPSFVGLLNETYGSGAEAAYSTRRLNGNVTDCMVIRRASDSTTTTIGFDGSGDIDEAAIETFCTGTTCTVYQWLDQSTNDNHATAANTGDEPTIYTGGALVKESGKVAAIIGQSQFMPFDTTLTSAQTMAWVGKINVFQYNRVVGDSVEIQSSSKGYINSTYASKPDNQRFNPTSISISGNNDTTSPYGQGLIGLYHSAFALGTGVGAGGLKGIGFNYDVSRSWNGPFQELIIYSDARTTQRTDIEENIGDYFTQNTPLLDTYTGAAAAYSLRLLRTAYTGDAVEVYNGSSYADIGFNVFGELDTVALAAHCGTSDGFVSKWYCQSGNSNDAVQTVTGSMPKIYDGSTGVVTENGKPAVEFDGSDDYFSLTSTLSTNNVCQILVSVYDTSASTLKMPLGGGTFWQHYSSNRMRIRTTSGDVIFTTGLSNGNQFIGFLNANAGAYTAHINNLSEFSGSAGNWYINQIGRGLNSNTYAFDNVIQEVILYESNQSDNRTGIESNINTFYDIF